MRPVALLALCFTVGCTHSTSSSVSVAVTAEPPGGNCAAGGDRIHVVDSTGTTTTYVCNGADGSSATVSVADEPSGSHCAAGGKAITTTSGGTSVTSYVCNGMSGANAMIVAAAEPPGAHCPSGGVKLTDSSGAASYVCNGSDGQSVTVTAASATQCPTGGAAVQVGSGAPISVCNGDRLNWSTLTASATAAANTAYLANGSSGVTLTLPASSGLSVGDEIKLIVDGTGSVAVAPASGQTFQYGSGALVLGTSWSQASVGANGSARPLASSADGTHLFSASGNVVQSLAVSTDSGATWAVRAGTSDTWNSVVSSSDGVTATAISQGGQIAHTTDSGATWSLHFSPAIFLLLAGSSDGTKLLAANYEGGTSALPGKVYVSTDSGTTWNSSNSPASGVNWGGVAVSANGSRMAAATNTGVIYTSTDSGSTWSNANNAPSSTWSGLAMSADGLRLVAVATSGTVYTSADGGTTWFQKEVPQLSWESVACSTDCQRIAIGYNTGFGGGLYVSTDFGTSWTATSLSKTILTIASSADGLKLAAADPAHVYLSGAAPSLVARPASALELTWVGGGTWFVSSVSGSIEAP